MMRNGHDSKNVRPGTTLRSGVDVAGNAAAMAKPQASVMLQDMLNQVKENQRLAAAEKAGAVKVLVIFHILMMVSMTPVADAGTSRCGEGQGQEHQRAANLAFLTAQRSRYIDIILLLLLLLPPQHLHSLTFAML